MEVIASAQNSLVREIRQAARQGALTAGGCCLAEGRHLLEEAIRSACRIEAVVFAESAEPSFGDLRTRRIVTLPDRLFASLAATETTQGILTLVHPPRAEAGALFHAQAFLLVLDAVQDPGNAGAMLRAAEAFGATGAVFLKGSVNPYNPKAVRASAGSLFRMPLLAAFGEEEFLERSHQAGLSLYAAMPHAERSPSDCDFTGGCALIVGSEGGGVREIIQARATAVSIPALGVESLNAAMAAGILLYEARRQRTAAAR